MDDWKLNSARDHGLSLSARPASLVREPGLLETTGHLFWRTALRGYLHCYHRLQIEHRENLPANPPFIIISNHSSHLDTLVLSAALPLKLSDCIYPIAAGDVFFRTPTISWFSAGLVNALPMWRKNCGAQAMKTLRAKLVNESCGYILFPEGTRTRDGQIKPFRCGLGMLVASTNVPVIPCYLHGAFSSLPAGRVIPRPTRLSLRVGKPMFFRDTPDQRDGWAQIASCTEAAIRQLAGDTTVLAPPASSSDPQSPA